MASQITKNRTMKTTLRRLLLAISLYTLGSYGTADTSDCSATGRENPSNAELKTLPSPGLHHGRSVGLGFRHGRRTRRRQKS